MRVAAGQALIAEAMVAASTTEAMIEEKPILKVKVFENKLSYVEKEL